MSESQPFDVRRAIEQSSSKSTLQELAKKGIHRVKVLDESMINKLIGDAVERIISTKTNLLSTDDRQKLIQASRAELDRLMRDHKETKDKAQLMEKDKGQLASDIENLEKQLQTQRKLADDTAKQRYEDGKSIMRGEVEDLKKKLSSVEADVEKRVRREIELEFQAKSATSVAQIDAMKQEMGRREQDILARGASMKEAELRTKLDEMQSKNMELSEKHSTQLEELKKSDDKMVATLSELFSKALEGVNKKLSDIKLRALAGGGGGGGGGGGMGRMEGDVEYRPSQATLESLVSSELESNLSSMQVAPQTAGKVASALDKLKAMRGGGGDKDKKEEKK